MRKSSVVTTYKIFLTTSVAIAAMSTAGCGATESTCTELQRTCGCDDRKPCPGDGSAGSGGGNAGGAGGTSNSDAARETGSEVDSSVDMGSGGKGGATGSGGTGGSAGASGAGGKSGAAGAGGSRDDAAVDASAPDGAVDGAGDRAETSIDGESDGSGGPDVESDVADAGPGIDAADSGPTCDVTKSPSEESCLIDEIYGVFVSPNGNDATGSGTRAAPYSTIAKAIQAAVSLSRGVYACDNGTPYAEQVTLPDTARVYGGFDCTDWTYATTRRVVVHAPSSPALIIHAVTNGVVVEDVEFDAHDAVGAGVSSIGAFIDTSSNVTFRRVKIVAGKGADGAGGANGAKGDDGPEVTAGLVGADAVCPSAVNGQFGGIWGQSSSCGSLGGAGGTATKGQDGSPGVAGNPHTNVSPPDVDNGGAKGATGVDGSAGSPGNAGAAGIVSATVGNFTSAGYTPAAATVSSAGSDGSPGQGGGGGGASNATDMCIGASGGAGGMGGCGGKGGGGGTGGGASVALMSWTSSISLFSCELVAGTGGTGGKGGNGGAPGLGKNGASGGAAYAADGGNVVGSGGHGGIGGNGGLGGPGSGGNGGPSYAIVHKGEAPLKDAVTLTAGTAGPGGAGGTASSTTAPTGTAGQTATEFPVP